MTLRLGDILELTDARVSETNGVLIAHSFTRVVVRGGDSELALDVASVETDHPSFIEAESLLEIDRDDIESRTGSDGEQVKLKPGRTVRVTCHLPNPVSPASMGYWLEIPVRRGTGGYELPFDSGTGAVFYKTVPNPDRAWERLGLAANERTAEEWIEQLAAGLRLELKPGDPKQGAEFCTFLRPRDAAWLVDPDGHRLVDANFSLRARQRSLETNGKRFRLVAHLAVPKKNGRSPVNEGALRLEDTSLTLERPLHLENDIGLQGVAVVTTEPARPVRWCVDLENIPTASPTVGALSFRAVWQSVARHTVRGLKSWSAKSHLTFFPTDVRPFGDAHANWSCRFFVDQSDEWRSALVGVQLHRSTQLNFELDGARTIDDRAPRFEVLARNEASQRPRIVDVEEAPDWLISLEMLVSTEALGTFLIGGVLLELGTLNSPSLLRVRPRSTSDLTLASVDTNLLLHTTAGRPRPGAEDPELGFEIEAEWLSRERPLVIDLVDDNDGEEFRTSVEIEEVANQESSRLLELRVRSASSERDLDIDAVVIDPSPLRVARVRSSSRAADEDSLIAVFRDSPEAPMTWQFSTETGEVLVLLPPQVVGEEMIKADLRVKTLEHPNGTPVPLRGELFDFRLSSPTRLLFDRTEVDTARAAAPWTLRRLLGRRRSGVGLLVKRAELELLYGLTTSIERDAEPALRVADREALFGSVPFPSALRRAWRQDREDPNDESLSYAEAVALWIRSLLYHPAQLPVFEDWASRERLVLGDGIDVAFRPTRQTSDPFVLEDYHPGSSSPLESQGDAIDVRDRNRLPLRGGADFGFESRNVYHSVLENLDKVDRPDRSQATVSGLTIGTLGGTGDQEALFDEGRSIIISETTQGRVDSLTIVRVGRIAMLWNHARHVIVYERTTRTAPRFEAEQPDSFEGLAALRKVREYIEITQPSRQYPDGGTTARQTGPVVGSFFESTVIPVRSAWGTDVQEGWVMPLFGPVPPTEANFYPSPKIFVELARARVKSGIVSQLVATPEKLLFFSSTRTGEGSNPDGWQARADIDFPVTERPRPPRVAYIPAFETSATQPDAQTHDYGQERFTVDLQAAEEAVNLMHGRPVAGLEARVHNVSLARGMPSTSAPVSSLEAVLGSPFAVVEAQVGDELRELAQYANKLAMTQSDALPRQIPGFRTQAFDILSRASSQIADFAVELDSSKDRVEPASAQWTAVQSEWTEKSRAAWRRHSEAVLGDTLRNTLETVADRLDTSGETEARSVVGTALESARAQSHDRIRGLPFVPERALERLVATTNEAVDGLRGNIEGVGHGWRVSLGDLERRFELEAPDALERELRGEIEGASTRLRSWMVDAGSRLKDGLGPLFADLPVPKGDAGPMRRILDGLETIHSDYADWIDLVTTETIPPFELGVPDWEALRQSLDPTFLQEAVDVLKQALELELLQPFKEAIEVWEGAIEQAIAELDAKVDEVKQRLNTLVGQGAEVLRAQGEVALGELRSELDEFAKQLQAQVDPAQTENLLLSAQEKLADQPWLKGIVAPFDDLGDILETEVQNVIDELRRALELDAAPMQELAGELEREVQRAVGSLRHLGERIERSATQELRGIVEGAEQGALELVRSLADGPITDTLRSTRERVGYYFSAAQDALDLTPAAAIFNDLGSGTLNALSAQLPFDRLRDRLLPQLEGFDLNRLLPDFAGLKLANLFDGVQIPRDPSDEYDWIDIRHGFDRHRLTAWSEVTIDKRFGRSLEVFDLSPLALRVQDARFKANSRLEARADRPLSQRTEGKLSADWVVDLNGEPVLTIVDAHLSLDDRGGLDFDFESRNLRLAPALQFVTDALQAFLSPEDGVTITPIAPGGIRAELSLPIPDIGAGAFTMTGITLYGHFDLLVAGGFEVSLGVWLSRPNRPFGIAVLFLGGGGWFGVDVRYRPPSVFETRVSVGISAGAMVAVNFGVARGSAGLLFTVGLDFYRNWTSRSGAGTVVSVGLLVWGEFSILSIASAYLRITLRIEYRNGSMTGYGRVELKIKICWCFTLRVDKSVRKRFSGGGERRSVGAAAATTAVTPRQAIKADLANSAW